MGFFGGETGENVHDRRLRVHPTAAGALELGEYGTAMIPAARINAHAESASYKEARTSARTAGREISAAPRLMVLGRRLATRDELGLIGIARRGSPE